MLRLSPSTRIFIATEPTSMSVSFDALAARAREVIRRDPLSGHLFVFRNRRGHRLKVLFWDGNGFVVYYKRLERGTFRFPALRGRSLEIRPDELTLLLAGLRPDRRLMAT